MQLTKKFINWQFYNLSDKHTKVSNVENFVWTLQTQDQDPAEYNKIKESTG